MNPYNPYGVMFDEMGNPIPQGHQNQYAQPNMYPYGMNTGHIGAYQDPIMSGYRQKAVTKKDILYYLQNMMQPREVEQVVEFDTGRTRHICTGYKEIVLLDKQIIQVPTGNGVVCVEVFFCPRCRKLLVNSQSLEVY